MLWVYLLALIYDWNTASRSCTHQLNAISDAGVPCSFCCCGAFKAKTLKHSFFFMHLIRIALRQPICFFKWAVNTLQHSIYCTYTVFMARQCFTAQKVRGLWLAVKLCLMHNHTWILSGCGMPVSGVWQRLTCLRMAGNKNSSGW